MTNKEITDDIETITRMLKTEPTMWFARNIARRPLTKKELGEKP